MTTTRLLGDPVLDYELFDEPPWLREYIERFGDLLLSLDALNFSAEDAKGQRFHGRVNRSDF